MTSCSTEIWKPPTHYENTTIWEHKCEVTTPGIFLATYICMRPQPWPWQHISCSHETLSAFIWVSRSQCGVGCGNVGSIIIKRYDLGTILLKLGIDWRNISNVGGVRSTCGEIEQSNEQFWILQVAWETATQYAPQQAHNTLYGPYLGRRQESVCV